MKYVSDSNFPNRVNLSWVLAQATSRIESPTVAAISGYRAADRLGHDSPGYEFVHEHRNFMVATTIVIAFLLFGHLLAATGGSGFFTEIATALMGRYHGYGSQGGAQGVSQATTNAVVPASIFILAANDVATELFFAQ